MERCLAVWWRDMQHGQQPAGTTAAPGNRSPRGPLCADHQRPLPGPLPCLLLRVCCRQASNKGGPVYTGFFHCLTSIAKNEGE